jgi:hypothetical protein
VTKTKLLVVLALVLLALVDVTQAGGRCGRWGGGYWGGGRGWGGPSWGWGGGWGGWGWGPSFGVAFVAPPAPVYRTVYVARPAPVYASYSGPSLYRAQVRLARLGYYPGPIDGDFGPMTSRAIRNYQADYGLPITGRLDYRTRASLGV